MWLNLGSGPHPAPTPWVNVDNENREDLRPVVQANVLRLPFRDGGAGRVYLGHVLEHIEWSEGVPVMLAEVRRVLRPGGKVCVVGPDVEKAIHRWSKGIEPWDIVAACLESYVSYQKVAMEYDRHRWNCTADRVIVALRDAGFRGVRTVRLGLVGRRWPVVSLVKWQCAVEAVA